jgi:hypothetical protein
MTDFVVGHAYRLQQPAFLSSGTLHQRSLKTSTLRTTDVFAEIQDGERARQVVKLTWISSVDMKTGYTKRDSSGGKGVASQQLIIASERPSANC